MKRTEDILNTDPRWFRKATDEQLREFLKVLEEQPECERKERLLTAFVNESKRRSYEYYENKCGGEWM